MSNLIEGGSSEVINKDADLVMRDLFEIDPIGHLAFGIAQFAVLAAAEQDMEPSLQQRSMVWQTENLRPTTETGKDYPGVCFPGTPLVLMTEKEKSLLPAIKFGLQEILQGLHITVTSRG